MDPNIVGSVDVLHLNMTLIQPMHISSERGRHWVHRVKLLLETHRGNSVPGPVGAVGIAQRFPRICGIPRNSTDPATSTGLSAPKLH